MTEREVVKRLPVLTKTARDLYLKSGNRCAFPGCDSPLLDDEGNWVGQICHIEAAMPGGERFNERMSNEQRRAAANLLLLCHPHHVVTNDEDAFPVDRLRAIKARHEARFGAVVAQIVEADVHDVTGRVQFVAPTRLTAWHELICTQVQLSHEELAACALEVAELLDRMNTLPRPTRGVLGVLVSRGDADFEGTVHLSAPELELACGLTRSETLEHLAILDRFGLAHLERDEVPAVVFTVGPMKSGWPFWSDLKAVAAERGASAEEAIRNLDFGFLE